MSHSGCSGSFTTGSMVVEKLRKMGFSDQSLQTPFEFKCEECNVDVKMDTLEFKCPHCGMRYAVTPCHSHDFSSVQAAGKENN